MSASLCRDCKEPIEWRKGPTGNVPYDPKTGDDHRDTCAHKPSRPCKKCGAEIVWTSDGPMDPHPVRIEGQAVESRKAHECVGLVPDRIKRPSRHHVSQHRIRRFQRCQLRAYFADVRGLDDPLESDPVEAGKLFAACLEMVTLAHHKAGDLAKTEKLSADELLAALQVISGRESWNTESMALARQACIVAAPKIDLRFTLVDEHGPLVERGFEMPVGDGVMVGGVVDLVESVGEEIVITDYKSGHYQDPGAKRGIQAGLYLAWARTMWPTRPRRFVLRYTSLDTPAVEIPADLDLEESAKATARAMVEKSRAQRENQGAWRARFGAHCDDCPFQSRCEEFKRRMAEPSVPPEIPATLEGIIEEIVRLGPAVEAANLVTRRVRALNDRAKEALGSIVDQDGYAKVGTYTTRLKTVVRKEYTVQANSYQVVDIELPKEGPTKGPLGPERSNPVTPGDPVAPEQATKAAGASEPGNQKTPITPANAPAATSGSASLAPAAGPEVLIEATDKDDGARVLTPEEIKRIESVQGKDPSDLVALARASARKSETTPCCGCGEPGADQGEGIADKECLDIAKCSGKHRACPRCLGIILERKAREKARANPPATVTLPGSAPKKPETPAAPVEPEKPDPPLPQDECIRRLGGSDEAKAIASLVCALARGESMGVFSTRLIALVTKLHGAEKAEALWAEAGGKWGGGEKRKKRCWLTAAQGRALVRLLPEKPTGAAGSVNVPTPSVALPGSVPADPVAREVAASVALDKGDGQTHSAGDGCCPPAVPVAPVPDADVKPSW